MTTLTSLDSTGMCMYTTMDEQVAELECIIAKLRDQILYTDQQSKQILHMVSILTAVKTEPEVGKFYIETSGPSSRDAAIRILYEHGWQP